MAQLGGSCVHLHVRYDSMPCYACGYVHRCYDCGMIVIDCDRWLSDHPLIDHPGLTIDHSAMCSRSVVEKTPIAWLPPDVVRPLRISPKMGPFPRST